MTVKEIKVKLIPTRIAKDLIVKHHYSHSWPGGNRLNYGVFYKGSLKGACTFGPGTNNRYAGLVEDTQPDEYLELTRMWLHDDLPKNSASRVIGICLRDIEKRFPQYKWIISYADTEQEHKGKIYQASNWTYTGTGGSKKKLIHEKTGQEIHTRTASDLGIRKQETLKELNIKEIDAKPKHRYFYFIDKRYKDKLTLNILPYP